MTFAFVNVLFVVTSGVIVSGHSSVRKKFSNCNNLSKRNIRIIIVYARNLLGTWGSESFPVRLLVVSFSIDSVSWKGFFSFRFYLRAKKPCLLILFLRCYSLFLLFLINDFSSSAFLPLEGFLFHSFCSRATISFLEFFSLFRE